MKQIKQKQHIEIEEKSQQLKLRMQTEIQINKHHALCQSSGRLEELDYTKLYFAYSGFSKIADQAAGVIQGAGMGLPEILIF